MTLYSPQHLLEFMRSVLLPLPGVSEGMSYDTPGFHVQKKLLCRMKEDGETLVLYHEDRDELIGINPEVYFVTEHYQNYPYVLIKLPLISREDLKRGLLNTWKMRATPKLLKAYELLQAQKQAPVGKYYSS